MLCQHCKTNQANIKMNFQYNNKVKQMLLCHECYEKMGAGAIKMGYSSSSPFDFLSQFGGWGSNSSVQPPQQAEGRSPKGILDEVGRNLTDMAKTGLIDPVIGRDKEVDRVIEILNRRGKNNPVLIGEPGVGKTAIAEGLALKITEHQVPAKLQNKVVYTLDVASLVAGTGVRGEFEEKVKQVIAELQQRKNIILFIDEIHLLVGAGSAQGSMDAGNILKPALARGELQVVGATTLKEYRMIEKDAALERRFQPVMVSEPSVDEATQILKGLRPKYEDYHQVRYSDEVIKACVSLSHRYIQDRFLPDKAIDLMDEAGSKLNLRASNSDTEPLHERLAQIGREKLKATQEENYERAAELRDEEARIEKQLEQPSQEPRMEVSVQDIQEIIETKTGIPVKKLQEAEQAKMKSLGDNLAAHVIGQQEAVQKLAKAIRRTRAGLKAKHRPIGSFLFVGPTGVGKTELTKCLAEELFGDKNALIRLDMSEYMEKHSVSKLIGSPPGYVGHDEAGQLTERVRRQPYSIILLDEIEKAHPDVQNMFLQVLEDGRLTDSQGRTVSFKDTVIIATSNAGVTQKTIKVGFDQKEEEQQNSVVHSLGAYFRPEFLNRFDAIIPFRHLTVDDLTKVVDLMLSEVRANMAELGVELTITLEAKQKLAELGYNPTFGARPLRRVIQEQIEDGIADLLVEETEVKNIYIMLKDDKIVVQKVS
jgi:ATP-dependent Clp protease ATP-binding subunit ClpE